MSVPAPFYDDVARAPKGAEARFLTCQDGVQIRVAHWAKGDKGTIFVFQGRTEYIEKYGPVIEKFVSMGYSVAAVDWRGQGLSDRNGKERRIGHVEDFRDFQNDVDTFMRYMEETVGLPKPYHLVGHSMGGAIGLRALLDGADFERAVFSAPMWGIYFKGILRPISKVMVGASRVTGWGRGLAPSTTINNYAVVGEFEDNTLTNNKEQFEWSGHQLRTHPDLELGGPSVHWIAEAVEASARLRRDAPPKQPCFCMYGTNERIVSTNAIDDIMSRWPNGELMKIEGAQHELFIETPDVTKRIWDKIEAFLA